jgi:N-acetylmuramoyl-L-alanine amidase
MVMMTGATAIPLSDWSAFSTDRVEVIRPTANIRESATTDSRIVGTARQGDKLTVVERQGTWYQVKTKDGKTGWVYASLVKG